MALCYTRLLCRRNINFQSFRSLYTCSPLNVAVSKPLCMASMIRETDNKKKSMWLPMPPHLIVYQIDLTSVLSIMHRTTGLILSSYAILLGLGTLFISGGIPCFIVMIQNLGLPSQLAFLGKTIIAFSATYHTLNAFRHLAWILVLFASIKELHVTNYAIVAVSALFAVILAAVKV